MFLREEEDPLQMQKELREQKIKKKLDHLQVRIKKQNAKAPKQIVEDTH